MTEDDPMGENYPTLHDLVRYGQEREKAQLRLVHSGKEWEAGLIVVACLLVAVIAGACGWLAGWVLFR